MDGLWVLRPFQQYFSRTRTIEGWTWKAVSTVYVREDSRLQLDSNPRFRDPKSEFSRQSNTSCLKVYLHVTFLKLISVAIFSIYASAGYGLCTLTARRRIVLAPRSKAL